ncbi:MAG: EamA family transporter [Terriglobia bacterium]
MQRSRLIPKWLVYALLSIFWWGIFGFLGKVGADRVGPRQMQILFTAGLIPIVVMCFWRLRIKVAVEKHGVTYSIWMGLFAALGVLTFFAAMEHGKASVVAPVTSLSPVLTVVLAVIVLKERLNKVQILGLFLAMASIVLLSL